MQELHKKIDESWEKLYPELSVACGGDRGWKAAAARRLLYLALYL
ncbi:hypothetical protein Defa_12870 [Desulfovibrio sp. TH_2024_36128]|uniref:Transposase n=1 Tax=Desulfovibrio falkowii TaxID=3136602 RepID=A0ABQ0E7X0_9BACT